MNEEIVNCLTWYAGQVAMVNYHEHDWSDEFARNYIQKVTEKFTKKLAECIDFDDVLGAELIELGFIRQSIDNDVVYLIPLYLLPIIPKGMALTRVDGEVIIYDGCNIEPNICEGCCIDYGVTLYSNKRRYVK